MHLIPVLAAALVAQTSDTLRIEVGAKEVNGGVYAPHAARVRVRVGDGEGQLTAEWTNELTIGDSAGKRVMRWITRGQRFQPAGDTLRWEIRQTYDAVTLAPYGYESQSSTGGFQRLRLEGRQIRGTRRAAGDTAVQQVDHLIDRPGFFGGASDLVPLATGLKEGSVMIAPFWTPAATQSELRIFTVLPKTRVDVEGTMVNAWKVEERRYSDKRLLATWYLVEKSPYMVFGEVPLPNGQVQRMSEVVIQPKT